MNTETPGVDEKTPDQAQDMDHEKEAEPEKTLDEQNEPATTGEDEKGDPAGPSTEVTQEEAETKEGTDENPVSEAPLTEEPADEIQEEQTETSQQIDFVTLGMFIIGKSLPSNKTP